MTRKEILALLPQGATIVKGYNYAIFSIRTRTPDAVAAKIRQAKQQIEDALPSPLLPFVCYCRPRSVVVPIPFDVSLGAVSDAIAPVLKDTDAKIPTWS